MTARRDAAMLSARFSSEFDINSGSEEEEKREQVDDAKAKVQRRLRNRMFVIDCMRVESFGENDILTPPNLRPHRRDPPERVDKNVR